MRLKHLGLMRVSMASRHFSQLGCLLMSLVLGVYAFTEYGWHRAEVPLAATDAAALVRPSGAGWFPLVKSPRDRVARDSADFVVDLWWNPAQAIIATGFGFAIGWLAVRLLMFLIRSGVISAHGQDLRHERRMTAAIKYSTAWFVPMLVSACIVLLRPLVFVGDVAGWTWQPSDDSLKLAAGVPAGFGVAMWWFWLVRLGTGAAPAVRVTVTAFYVLAVPVLAVGCTVGWWFALRYVTMVLFNGLNLNF